MVFIHLAEGYEEVEALTCVDVLRRAGIDARMVSVTGSLTVKGAHGIDIAADLLFEDADYDECEMIVLPGGLPGATNLRDHLEGKKATIYPGMEKHLAGAKATGKTVTVDGNVITGMGPALAMEFALALVEFIKGANAKKEVASGLLYDKIGKI